jgi:hypothetical protein
MKMKLYEYAVIFNPLPTKDENDRGAQPKAQLVVDVTRVLANNDKEAMMLAARAIPEQYTDKLDRLEIAIRPF